MNIEDDFLDGTGNFDNNEDAQEDSTIKELNKLYQHGTSYVSQNSEEMNKEVLLYLYARFKYITEGPCNVIRPAGLLNFEAKAKWDCWQSLSKTTGVSKEIAREQYIAKLDEVQRAKSTNTSTTWRTGFEPSKKGKFEEAMKKGTFGVRISIHEKINDPDEINKLNVFDLCKDGFSEELKDYFKKVDKTKFERLLNQQDENKMTLLMWACDIGHLDIVKFLTEAGANLNLVDADGQTCLHYAVSCDNIDIVKYLATNKNLNKNLCDNDKNKAINLTKNKSIISLLS